MNVYLSAYFSLLLATTGLFQERTLQCKVKRRARLNSPNRRRSVLRSDNNGQEIQRAGEYNDTRIASLSWFTGEKRPCFRKLLHQSRLLTRGDLFELYKLSVPRQSPSVIISTLYESPTLDTLKLDLCLHERRLWECRVANQEVHLIRDSAQLIN